MAGTTSFWRQARASGHLDLSAVSCQAVKWCIGSYIMCTSSGTFALTSVCSCSQLHDLASKNSAKMTASIAACILRLYWSRGMAVSAGACSCVCGSKGAFDSMAVFSETDGGIAYYAALSAEPPAVTQLLSGGCGAIRRPGLHAGLLDAVEA